MINKNKTNHQISSNSHPSATANKAIHSLKIGGLQNQREHHIILTKYAALHPKADSENNVSGAAIIVASAYVILTMEYYNHSLSVHGKMKSATITNYIHYKRTQKVCIQ